MTPLLAFTIGMLGNLGMFGLGMYSLHKAKLAHRRA